MIAVTSFSQAGYEKYGKDFIETSVNWPTEIIYYTESPIGMENERDFFQIPNVTTFLTYLKNWPKAHGKDERGYNYNFDLWKFSRKIFCQYDVLKEYKGKVFWLDADITFKKPINKEFLENLFNGRGVVTYLRPGWHSETGFVGFDTEHPYFQDFLETYIGYLQKGKFIEFPRWHDCELLDRAVVEVGLPVEDLTRNWKPKSHYTLKDLDVFSDSVLSEYMEHKKGKKK